MTIEKDSTNVWRKLKEKGRRDEDMGERKRKRRKSGIIKQGATKMNLTKRARR